MAAPGLPEGFKPLLGTEEAVVDEKGRLLLSKKKRERLSEGFVAVIGKLGCLIFYPQAVWDMLMNEVFQVETMNPAREDYTRLLLSTADDEITFDQPGRMVIPSKLREEAKLKPKEGVLILGCGDRVEVWNATEWAKFQYDPENYGKERRAALEKAYGAMVGKGVPA